jgi:hypothetical protein
LSCLGSSIAPDMKVIYRLAGSSSATLVSKIFVLLLFALRIIHSLRRHHVLLNVLHDIFTNDRQNFKFCRRWPSFLLMILLIAISLDVLFGLLVRSPNHWNPLLSNNIIIFGYYWAHDWEARCSRHNADSTSDANTLDLLLLNDHWALVFYGSLIRWSSFTTLLTTVTYFLISKL